MPRGLTRRLPTVLLAAALAGALATTGCAKEAAAASVDDEIISDDDLMEELDALAGSDALLAALQIPADAVPGDADESFSQEYVGFVLSQRIVTILLHRALDDADASVTDAELDQVSSQIDSTLAQSGESVADLPTRYVDRLARDVAASQKFSSLFPDEDSALAALIEEAEDADISVSSRYGTWDGEQLRIAPPLGPTPAPGSDDASVPSGADAGSGVDAAG